MIKFIKQHINSLLWAVIVLILCGMPSSGFPSVKFFNIPHLDKIVHFGLYFVFTLLLISENNKQSQQQVKLTRRTIFISLFVAVLYGLLIEIMQFLVFTSRSAEFWDVFANTMGAICAILVYRIVNKVSRGMI